MNLRQEVAETFSVVIVGVTAKIRDHVVPRIDICLDHGVSLGKYHYSMVFFYEET